MPSSPSRVEDRTESLQEREREFIACEATTMPRQRTITRVAQGFVLLSLARLSQRYDAQTRHDRTRHDTLPRSRTRGAATSIHRYIEVLFFGLECPGIASLLSMIS